MTEENQLVNIYNPYENEDVGLDGTIEITSIKEAIGESGLKILVYGQSGAGKTVLAATTGKPTLILNAEGGLISVKEAPIYIETVKISYLKQLNTIYHLLTTQEKIYDWIVIDSISEIAEKVLINEMKQSKDGRQFWYKMAEVVSIIIKYFGDLKDYNVLFTAKLDRYVDQDTGRTNYGPLVPGNNLKAGLPYLFDEIFALRVEEDSNGKKQRFLQTDLDMQYLAKDRSGELNDFEKPNMKKIEMKIRGDDYVKYIKPKPVSELENKSEAENNPKKEN